MIDYLPYLFKQWSEERNCWWLVRDFYRQLGITLPDYPWESDIHKRYDMITSVATKQCWQQLDKPVDHCIAVSGKPTNHCGIYLEATGALRQPMILHLEQNCNGKVDRLDYFQNLKYYEYQDNG